MSAESIVREFWRRMASNDFASVAGLLASDFMLEWPQSNERIRGPARFVAVNVEYPAHGPWQFTVHRLIASGPEVVTETSITDGVQRARAISFFSIAGERILRLVEFWPEPYPAPPDRAHLIEPIE
jgi:hypothetical protein